VTIRPIYGHMLHIRPVFIGRTSGSPRSELFPASGSPFYTLVPPFFFLDTANT